MYMRKVSYTAMIPAGLVREVPSIHSLSAAMVLSYASAGAKGQG